MHSRYEVRGHVHPVGRPTQHTVIFEISGTPDGAGVKAREVFNGEAAALAAGDSPYTEIVLEGPNGLFDRAVSPTTATGSR